MDYAHTILEQLGGNKFIVMTGSKNLVRDDKRKSLTMKLTKKFGESTVSYNHFERKGFV